jgi:alkanesulfonate monooxygenase SsuD/methylene tetrahydromethanopterin reductase-like flavin-dependent oxidoreductase (luciferase family)
VAREHTLAMKALWGEDEASYEGEFVSIPPTWSWPKPVQRPHPPILLGGTAGPKLFDHVAEYGDGWIPIGGAGLTDAIPRLRARVAAAGRDPSALQIVPFGSIPDPGKLEHFHAIGITEVVFRVPPAPADVVLPKLDEFAAVRAAQ